MLIKHLLNHHPLDIYYRFRIESLLRRRYEKLDRLLHESLAFCSCASLGPHGTKLYFVTYSYDIQDDCGNMRKHHAHDFLPTSTNDVRFFLPLVN